MPEFALKKYKADVRDAAVSALNKMASRIRTRISFELRQKYNIKKQDVDSHIYIKKATRSDMTIEITAGRKKIGLDHYGKITRGAVGVRVQIIKGKPVEVRVKQDLQITTHGHGKALVIPKEHHSGRNTDPTRVGTFVAKRAEGDAYGTGALAVFARKGPNRNPLKRVMGPSIADLAGSRMIEKIIQDVYKSDFDELLSHEIKYFTTR